MRAFWLPSQAPDTKRLLDKPSQDTLCPASGAKLRFKDLTILNFTRPPPGDSEACYAIDPVSHDALTNSHQMIVLKPTGERINGDCEHLPGQTIALCNQTVALPAVSMLMSHSKL